MKRILIADGSSLAAAGAETLLHTRPETVVQKVSTSAELLAEAGLPPDVVILADQFDPDDDTLMVVQRLLSAVPRTRVIVTGLLSDGLLIRDLFAVGVRGYLAVNDDLIQYLPLAVDAVLNGRLYLSPTANSEYLVLMHSQDRNWHLDPEARAVLRLLARGFTIGSIAVQLRVKPRRVYWVREKLRRRFGAATNEHLISRALAEGFGGPASATG